MFESAARSAGRIFINYRREETAYPAGWLYDRLADHYGRDQVFKDVDSIDFGDDFVERIAGAVGSCDVLLALIGRDWLSVADANGRPRLDDPEDFVRLEIEAALSRDVRIIPILIEGASMPRADELPASLARLARRQALELNPAQFDFDTGRLLQVLDSTLAGILPKANDPAPPPPGGNASTLADSSEAPASLGTRPQAEAEPSPEPGRRLPVATGPSSGPHLSRTQSRLSMRTRIVIAVAAIALLAVAAILLPRLTSSPRSVEGNWISTDVDGSQQRLDITGSGAGYAAQLHDDAASACDGAPLDADARVNSPDDSTFTASYEYACPSGKRGVATITYYYSQDNDTLRDDTGVTWKRD